VTDKHLNQYQLGERWSLSPRTLERWRWEGFGPPHLKIGGRILYRQADVQKYENEHLRDSTAKDDGVPLSDAENPQTVEA
jgi:hypothetical protein